MARETMTNLNQFHWKTGRDWQGSVVRGRDILPGKQRGCEQDLLSGAHAVRPPHPGQLDPHWTHLQAALLAAPRGRRRVCVFVFHVARCQ